MPTTVTVVVDPGGGQDYTTLAGAIAGEARNLVTADEVCDILIQGDWSGGEEANWAYFASGDWTCDSTRKILVRTDSANRAGPTTALDTSKYIIGSTSSATTGGIGIEAGIVIDVIGLQIDADFWPIAVFGGTVLIDKCWVNAETADQYGIQVFSDTTKIRNSIFSSSTASGTVGVQAEGTVYLHNNLVTGFGTGGDGSIGTLHAVNNGLLSNTTALNSPDTDTTNSTSTPTFVSSTYQLDSADTTWAGNGTDLDSDSNLAVTEDMSDQARPASSPAIGPDEPPLAAGGSIWMPTPHDRIRRAVFARYR